MEHQSSVINSSSLYETVNEKDGTFFGENVTFQAVGSHMQVIPKTNINSTKFDRRFKLSCTETAGNFYASSSQSQAPQPIKEDPSHNIPQRSRPVQTSFSRSAFPSINEVTGRPDTKPHGQSNTPFANRNPPAQTVPAQFISRDFPSERNLFSQSSAHSSYAPTFEQRGIKPESRINDQSIYQRPESTSEPYIPASPSSTYRVGDYRNPYQRPSGHQPIFPNASMFSDSIQPHAAPPSAPQHYPNLPDQTFDSYDNPPVPIIHSTPANHGRFQGGGFQSPSMFAQNVNAGVNQSAFGTPRLNMNDGSFRIPSQRNERKRD